MGPEFFGAAIDELLTSKPVKTAQSGTEKGTLAKVCVLLAIIALFLHWYKGKPETRIVEANSAIKFAYLEEKVWVMEETTPIVMPATPGEVWADLEERGLISKAARQTFEGQGLPMKNLRDFYPNDSEPEKRLISKRAEGQGDYIAASMGSFHRLLDDGWRVVSGENKTKKNP